MKRRSTTLPVSVSTSTTATWAPKGNVGALAWKLVITWSGSPESVAVLASSAQDRPMAGVPAT